MRSTTAIRSASARSDPSSPSNGKCLTDGAGPLFNPTSEYLMADVLQRIEEDLDPDQGARR